MIVACVLRSGGRFMPEYVEALHEGVLSHAPDDAELVCLSDVPVSCERIPLATDLPGWWAKMELFRPGLFSFGKKILYLDLDTVVIGDLSDLLAWDGTRAVLSDLYDPTKMASGVMLWKSGSMDPIWQVFSKDPEGIVRRYPHRMDHFLRRYLNGSDRIQDLYPDQVVSYKADIRGRVPPFRRTIRIPRKARLICMHGEPRLTDLPAGNPVRKEWGR